MDLSEFVAYIQTQPLPVGIVAGDEIVEGLARDVGGWTAEQITAEAFHQDVFSVDDETWESGLAKVKKEMSK